MVISTQSMTSGSLLVGLLLALAGCGNSESILLIDENSDNLNNRTIELLESATRAVGLGEHKVAISLVEHEDDSLQIDSEALTHSVEGGVQISVSGQGAWTHYGFVLEYRTDGSEPWQRFELRKDDPSTVWSTVSVKLKNGNAYSKMYVLEGLGASYTENFWWSFLPEMELEPADILASVGRGQTLELRILPLPAWDWSDWRSNYNVSVRLADFD